MRSLNTLIIGTLASLSLSADTENTDSVHRLLTTVKPEEVSSYIHEGLCYPNNNTPLLNHLINQNNTALYMLSSEGESIGQGKNHAYLQDEHGHFFINRLNNGILVRFRSCFIKNGKSSIDWNLEFTAPKREKLSKGRYLNAQRSTLRKEGHPGLDVFGCGKNSCALTGEFEILELTYSENGEIYAFAANFVQNDHLIGNVRYNSTVPVLPMFKDTAIIKPRDPSQKIGTAFTDKAEPYLVYLKDDE